MTEVKQPEGTHLSLSRLLIGGACFGLAQSLPLFIPLVISSDLQSEPKTVLSGLMLFGLPEIGSFIAISILGKAGYDWLKSKMFDLFKRARPTADVGPIRYYTGITIFCILLTLGIIDPYVSDFFPAYLKQNHRLYISFADAVFVINFFIIGGDFWDKLRALFVYEARANFS